MLLDLPRDALLARARALLRRKRVTALVVLGTVSAALWQVGEAAGAQPSVEPPALAHHRAGATGATGTVALATLGVCALAIGGVAWHRRMRDRMDQHAREHERALQKLAKLSRQVLEAQEEERARVSRDLHDELGQLLTAVRLELAMAERSAGQGAAASIQSAQQAVHQAAEEVRRICQGLRPPLLDDLGLEPAVRWLVEEFQKRTGVAVKLHVELDDAQPVPASVGLCTYRVLQEALNNVGRHAQAAVVEVTLASERGSLALSVCDDGRGFDPEEARSSQGCGLAGMRERAGLAGGTVALWSAHLQGTRVLLRIPLPEARPGKDSP